jgi:uncharacterized protein (TIGR03437 family)
MTINRRTFLQVASTALCLRRTARAATLLRQPYLQDVQATRASVLWTAQQTGCGTATAVAPDGTSFTVPAATEVFEPADTGLTCPFYRFQADFAGLLPGTLYSYSVAVDGQVLVSGAGPLQFQTAPQYLAASPFQDRAARVDGFSFLAFGDSGAGSCQQQILARLMAAEPDISMVVHVGDLAYPDGTFEEFEDSYFGINAPLMARVPFFSTPGNHEYNTSNAAPYLAGVATPECGVAGADRGRYYSFDWDNAHFVSVDSNLLATSRAPAMLAWLNADLAATDRHWRIVFLHHTPYPTGFHLGDPICAAVQQFVNPIVESHGVQLLLAGHEHGYERTYPLAGGQVATPPAPSTTYVVTGGGGGALESVGSSGQTAISVEAFNYLRIDVKGRALTITAIGLDGAQVDRVTLGAANRVAIDSVLSKGDYTSPIAPGSLVAISGQDLARASALSPGYPLPAGLAGVSLKVAGQPAPLLSVSSTQIEAQIPYHVSGPVMLEVSTPSGFASASITVSPEAPSLLQIVTPRGLFCGANPARPGDLLLLHLTGLGEVRTSVESGRAAPFVPDPVVSPVEVWLGPMQLETRFAGLAPGRAGVYRVDVAIPTDLPDGIYALRVTAGGAGSRPANLDVFSRGPAYRNNRARSRVVT